MSDEQISLSGVFLSHPGSGGSGKTSGGLPYEIRASIDETGGALRLIEIEEPPRSEATIHRHDYDEAWYILGGRYALWIEGRWQPVGPGDFLFVHGGLAHGFAVPGPGPGRKLSIVLPTSEGSLDTEPLGIQHLRPHGSTNGLTR